VNWYQKLKFQIPIPIQLFCMGALPALPILAISLLYTNGITFSGEFIRIFWFSYAIWVTLHFMVMWRMCHEPFQTLANQVRAIHQGDYSQRLIQFSRRNALAYLHDEINTLADELQGNRLAFLESRRRFQYLIDQIDMGVVAFDDKWRITMVNHCLARLLDDSAPKLLGIHIESVGLEALKSIAKSRTLWLTLPGKSSRYVVHARSFRDEGRPQKLYLLTDVKTHLREEERNAWKRLIRVLGHELNNSLTPIISLSNSLQSRFKKMDLPESQKETTIEALDIISQRAEGMNRFVRDYAKLAKLPDPNRTAFDLEPFVSRIVQLMDIPELKLAPGPASVVYCDQQQTEQLFINILQNAQQAIPEERGRIELTWTRESSDAAITIRDNGPGIEKKENLFVPFFSTKPGGSGIGLVLSRQIAEVNGGSIDIDNVEAPDTGCIVHIRLPLDNQ
jgi:two-component system nitrogen regulation sensor histidine kinase NtrY